MEFSTMNTKTQAEKGAFLHLKHPALDYLLWDGEGDKKKKVGVMVRGTESKTVQDRLKAVNKERLTNPDDDSKAGLDFVVSLVFELIGIDRDGKPAASTDENIRWFFQLSDGFVEQVLEFAKKRASFFSSTAAP